MKPFKKILLIFCSIFFVSTATLTGAELLALKSELEPIVKGKIKVAFLSGKKATHDEARGLLFISRELEKASGLAKKLGFELNQNVNVLIFKDLNVSSREIWHVYGINPDKDFFKTLEMDLLKLNQTTDIAKACEIYYEIRKKYAPFSFFPMPKDLSDGVLKPASYEEISEFIGNVKSLMDKPVLQAEKFYSFRKNNNSYSTSQQLIQIYLFGNASIQAHLDTILHEFAHHLFSCEIYNQFCANVGSVNYPVDMANFWSFTYLTSYNELWADYFSLACGRNLEVLEWLCPGMDVELKRYFSKHRTLPEFMEKIKSDPKYTGLLESHVILNPFRSFLWELRLNLSAPIVNKFVAHSIKNVISRFKNSVPKLIHLPVSTIEPGSFMVVGVPNDIISCHMSLLWPMKKMAASVLPSEQLAIFKKIGTLTFGKDLFEKAEPAD